MAGRGRPGRPSELDREKTFSDGRRMTVEARILELVRAGASYPAAARSCGIPESTFEKWTLEAYGGERFGRFRTALKEALGDQQAAEELSIARAHRGVPVRTTTRKTIRKPVMVGRSVVRDENGEIVYQEEVTESEQHTTKVYWQAAAWMLERKAISRPAYPRPLGALHEGQLGQGAALPDGEVPEEAEKAVVFAFEKFKTRREKSAAAVETNGGKPSTNGGGGAGSAAG